MRLMRVSLTARYVSHPTIDFSRKPAGYQPRLGLGRPTITYHRSRASLPHRPTIHALRSLTSRFSFPSVGRAVRVRDHRNALPLGLPRARRA
jgi:hypothetical protein